MLRSSLVLVGRSLKTWHRAMISDTDRTAYVTLCSREWSANVTIKHDMDSMSECRSCRKAWLKLNEAETIRRNLEAARIEAQRPKITPADIKARALARKVGAWVKVVQAGETFVGILHSVEGRIAWLDMPTGERLWTDAWRVNLSALNRV